MPSWTFCEPWQSDVNPATTTAAAQMKENAEGRQKRQKISNPSEDGKAEEDESEGYAMNEGATNSDVDSESE